MKHEIGQDNLKKSTICLHRPFYLKYKRVRRIHSQTKNVKKIPISHPKKIFFLERSVL